MSDAAAPAEHDAIDPGPARLRYGAIGFVSNLIMGLASTAPAYGLASTIGLIVAIGGMGIYMPSVIIVSFLPMLFIALAYRHLNAADPDCGTTFSWMARAMGAGWGWLGGWIAIFSGIVVNASQAQIAGSYTFQLFGFHVAAKSTFAVTVLGVLFIALLTYVCWKGIEISARIQELLVGLELATLILFAVVALIRVYTTHPQGSITVAADWFNPAALGIQPMLVGMLLGVFLYWGWDTGVSVNEETKNPRSAPGTAAVLANFVLVGVFLLVSVAAQAYAGPGKLAKHADDIFAGALSSQVLGPLHFLLTIAVLTSATAATQTTIMPCARTALSMARRGALPARYGQIHHKNQVPGYATIVTGVLSAVWYIAMVSISTNVLADVVVGVGFLVSLYYGFTGIACAIFFRRELHKSIANLLTMGVLPVLGAVILFVVFARGMVYYTDRKHVSSQLIGGLGIPDWIVILLIVSGVGVMLVARVKLPDFFRRERRVVAGEPFPTASVQADGA
ncbi:MAG: APC family permease [Mycobacterium sp.]|nr:APC family permease [Mycobacterium sp.]